MKCIEIAALVVCLFAIPALSAEIAGSVVDPQGAALLGAVVKLECRGAAPRETVANEEGQFTFQTTETSCFISMQTPGFRPLRVEARPLLRLTLELAPQRSEVTVSEAETENVDTVTLDRETLRKLPVLGNDPIAAAAELLSAPAIGSAGASMVVDGMEGPMRKIPPSLIQEIRINQNAYSAEYARPGRGRIEIVTRKGEPQFHGGLQYEFRDSALNARNAFAPARPDEQLREWSAVLSGPLWKRSRTTFFTSLEREAADEQALVLARSPEGEIRLNSPVPQRETEWNFGATSPRPEGGSMTLRYEFGMESADNEGVGGFRLPETAALSRSREHELTYSQRVVFSPRLVGELQIRGGHSSDRRISLLPGVARTVVEEAFTGGGAQADVDTTEIEGQMSGVLSWNRGRHVVKAGVNVPEINRARYRDNSNREGVWSYSTLADYLAGRPYSFQQQPSGARFAFPQREYGLFVQHDVQLWQGLNVGWGVRYDWQNLVADRNNLAPRLSAAWAPGTQRKVLFRAGAGVFYDKASAGAWADVLRSDPARVRQVLIVNPGYPDPYAGGSVAAQAPANTVRFSPGLRSPYLLHYSLGAEWKLRANSALTATYLGARGVNLFRSLDANAPIGGARPDPAFAIVRVVENGASMKSNALELAWRGKMARRVDANLRYTLAWTRNNTGGLAWLPPDSRDLSREWARADEDQRHRFQTLASADTWMGFELGAILSIDSGRPYGLTTGRDDNGDGRAVDRPAGVRRNSEQGFGAARLDLRLTREFELGKWGDSGEPKLEVRFDAFNALNRVNRGTPVGNLQSPYFGRAVSARAARQLQLTVEFSF